MAEPLILIDACTRDTNDPDRLLIVGRVDGILHRLPVGKSTRDGSILYAQPELRPVLAKIWLSAIDGPILTHDGHADSGYLYPDSEVHPEHPDQDREVCRCQPRTLSPEAQGQALRDALWNQNKHIVGTTVDKPGEPAE